MHSSITGRSSKNKVTTIQTSTNTIATTTATTSALTPTDTAATSACRCSIAPLSQRRAQDPYADDPRKVDSTTNVPVAHRPAGVMICGQQRKLDVAACHVCCNRRQPELTNAATRTTEPPVLSTKHPIRQAFVRYGSRASRHPVITLLISVAAGAILIFPFPFLYTNNFANGSSNLPGHVWTSAHPFEGDVNTQADVVMRSVWVHGDYMKALEPTVLHNALEIQDALLGPTVNFDPRITFESEDDVSELALRNSLHAINGLHNQSWFFHSPLQYWGSSSENLEKDTDIIRTVNERSHHPTSINITLRPSIVFSGKRFENHRLVAADALVVTLVHMLDSPVGSAWGERAQHLANTVANGRWQVYPHDGIPLKSQLYEFKFQPLSFLDDVLLGIAYTLTALYFLLSLTKLRALKSRFGLIIAVMTQIGVSIMSSFTLCAILKIDLSKIPRETYPLVVLTIGLENMFRLINAIIITHPENSTSSRISEALGNTGYIAMAGVTQNLAILWVLSKVVTPGVAAFCTFAAIALTFDFFYLLTFFVAVLSVEVRRTELGESLSRATKRKSHNLSISSEIRPENKTWKDALLRVDTPLSTRVAGTVVMVAFILGAQRHFFDQEHPITTMTRFMKLLTLNATASGLEAEYPAMIVNQARTPQQWLRLQDHQTAREVINVIKPEAHSYLARVYDPVVFVLDGSDRRSSTGGVRLFLPAAYDFIQHQWLFFLTSILLTIVAVAMLMNYLLWNETTEEEDETRPDDQSLLAVRSLRPGHSLDIVMLSASAGGKLASVGLDRRICVWDLQEETKSHIMDVGAGHESLFPVAALTLDNSGEWLAVVSAMGRIVLWNTLERRIVQNTRTELTDRQPTVFFSDPTEMSLLPEFILVQHNGHMVDINFNKPCVSELRICKSPLVTMLPLQQHKTRSISQIIPRVITASRHSCVHIATQQDSVWVSKGFHLAKPSVDEDFTSVVPLLALNAFLAVSSHYVDLIDLETQLVMHTFHVNNVKPHSLHCLHSSKRQASCGSVGLYKLSLAYTTLDTNECILQTYRPKFGRDMICIRDQTKSGDRTCCSWDEAKFDTHTISNPGSWDTMDAGFVVGIRKKVVSEPLKREIPNQSNTGLRRRGAQKRQENTAEDEDTWEAWMLSTTGETASIPLNPNTSIAPSSLLVTSLGPVSKAGRRSIALGFGNIIKVISVGTERFDRPDYGNGELSFASVGRRKRPLTGRKKSAME